MDDSRPSLLLKANRQIAEVRDEVARVDVRVDEVQAKNAAYLEEISLLDSEVTRMCARAAQSEQRLAEMFEQKRRCQELLQEQQAAESQAITERTAELVSVREKSSRLAAENAAQVHASEQRAASDEAARRRVAADIKDLECKHSAQKSVAETARRRLEKHQDEIAADRRLQEDLHRKLRQAAEAQQSSLENQQTLKEAITSKGGDPAMDVAGEQDDAKETEAVRSELAAAEESCRQAEASLAAERDSFAQEVASFESKLEDARTETDRRKAMLAAEAAKVDAQMKVESERNAQEEAAIAEISQQMARLQDTLSELRERPRKNTTLQDGNTKMVREQLRQERDQIAAVEVQWQASQDGLHSWERRRVAIEAEGLREAQQVKAKIQELWRALEVAASGE